jgi:hypothetical protein
VQRSRSALRAPETTGELLGDFPEPVSQAEPPSPRVLLEEVRSPGVARAEVDALLSGLVRPLGPGESARERADLLLEILEDEQVRDYAGSGERTVGHVAVLQLVELGFPYALEVPPELYAQARAAAGHREARPWEGGARRGWGMGETLPAVLLALDGQPTELQVSLAWILGVALTSFVPASLAGSAPVVGRRWLHTLLKLAVAVPALPWVGGAALLVAMAIAGSALPLALFAVFPLGMGLLRLGGARFLFSPPTGEEPPKLEED